MEGQPREGDCYVFDSEGMEVSLLMPALPLGGKRLMMAIPARTSLTPASSKRIRKPSQKLREGMQVTESREVEASSSYSSKVQQAFE